jgi:hypothetical protein
MQKRTEKARAPSSKPRATEESASEDKPLRENLPALDREQGRQLKEALRRAGALQNRTDAALIAFGAWVVDGLFGGDVGAALAHRRENAVWANLLARCNGPALRLNPKFLHVAVRIAGLDRRITADGWQRLDPARKELLLPLGDEALLRKAAAHVLEAELGYDGTRTHVASLRNERGRAPKARMTAPRVQRLFGEFRERIAEPAFLARLARLREELPGAQRTTLRAELRALRQAVEKLESKLR